MISGMLKSPPNYQFVAKVARPKYANALTNCLIYAKKKFFLNKKRNLFSTKKEIFSKQKKNFF